MLARTPGMQELGAEVEFELCAGQGSGERVNILRRSSCKTVCREGDSPIFLGDSENWDSPRRFCWHFLAHDVRAYPFSRVTQRSPLPVRCAIDYRTPTNAARDWVDRAQLLPPPQPCPQEGGSRKLVRVRAWCGRAEVTPYPAAGRGPAGRCR